MTRNGFSIIEVTITILILGILLTLAVVSMSTSQRHARDAERKADVEAIAMHLEDYYQNPKQTPGVGAVPGGGYGSYPGTSFLFTDSEAIYTYIPDITSESLRAPGVKSDQPMSLVPATNNTQTTTGVLPRPTISTYVYQPIQHNGTSLCTTHALNNSCRKFTLYYMTEDSIIHTVVSKNQ